MFKITTTLFFIFFGLILQAQSISKRTVDSSGVITVFTTVDTISNGSKYCAARGIILNIDSNNNYYALTFYFKSPQSFSLTNKDKIYIRYNDGKTYAKSIYEDAQFIDKGEILRATIPVSESTLEKIYKNQVISISLVTEKFKHTIKVDKTESKSIQDLAEYMLGVNVFDENGINWSELTKSRFPEK